MAKKKEELPKWEDRAGEIIDTVGQLQALLAEVSSVLKADKTPVRVISPKGHVLLIDLVDLNLEVPAICLRTKRP